ncbi:MAG: hypothetical protein EXQ79_04565 [Acidimicrobiia bacterium]|nr:hypothetical protein [Acidimicrobiia bacterium]
MLDSATDAEAAALERLHTLGETIVDGVERSLPAWVVAHVRRVVDAWDRLDAPERARAETAAREAGTAASARVTAELCVLMALDPAEQRATPLEIVRTATREPTAVLQAAGIPGVVRDAFDERAFPDDLYGLVPNTLGDLGDETLAPLHLAWGLAKTAVLRARSRS